MHAAAILYMLLDRSGVTGGTNVRRPSQGTAPVRPLSAADLSQTRTPPSLDRPTSPPHSSPTSSAFSNDVHELRQLVARLQSQNSQLTHISQQQQMTISQLEVGYPCWPYVSSVHEKETTAL